MLRRTKIVATLGPATDDPKILDEVIAAGVDVVGTPVDAFVSVLLGELVLAGVDDEQVGYGGEAPLEAHVHIHVVDLVVVLHKGGEEQLLGEGNVQPGAHQDQVRFPEVNADSVVVGQRVMRRVHAALVLVHVGQPVRLPDRGLVRHAEYGREMIGFLEELAEGMPPFTGSEEEQQLLIDYLTGGGR